MEMEMRRLRRRLSCSLLVRHENPVPVAGQPCWAPDSLLIIEALALLRGLVPSALLLHRRERARLGDGHVPPGGARQGGARRERHVDEAARRLGPRLAERARELLGRGRREGPGAQALGVLDEIDGEELAREPAAPPGAELVAEAPA